MMRFPHALQPAMVLTILGLFLLSGFPGPLSPTRGLASGPVPVPFAVSVASPAPSVTSHAGLVNVFHPVGPAPPKPTRTAAQFVRPNVVNPQSYYSAEPAPMGIADFGVDQHLHAYTYNTTQFYGDVKLGKLATYGSGIGGSAEMGYQLNVVLWFDSGGHSFYYWIQDVAFLDTSTSTIDFLNNIWNFSGSGASVASGDVSGNGSASGFYYCGASSTLPGNYVVLSTPADIGLKVVSLVVKGHALVKFEYQDTGGWVTYDDVTFTTPSSSDHGFIVDGTSYNPTGYLFNDAELIMGGPGGGSNTQVNRSAQRMTLSYWNGHNFQAVMNAYDHGSDTAEGVTNSVIGAAHFRANGTLFANATAGSGSVGTLYNRSFTAFVNVTSAIPIAQIRLNNTSVGSFVGGRMNLTIAPGTYNVSLYTNGTWQKSAKVTVAAGGYATVRFGNLTTYGVTFKESGLPLGTNWSVAVAGTKVSTTSAQIVVPVWNGTWSYAVESAAMYRPTPSNGTVTVSGATTAVSITWAKTYTVTLKANGLTASTSWSATLGGITEHGTGPTLVFVVVNGTYAYSVPSIPGWRLTGGASSGNVTVAGSNGTVTLAFTQVTYLVTFVESGLPAGTLWNVTIGTITQTTNSTRIVFSLGNGSYSYSVGKIAGWALRGGGYQGFLTIGGGGFTISERFAPMRFAVAFVESGLPTGTTWSVTIGGTTLSSTVRKIVFLLVDGNYTFTIGKIVGHVATPSSGKLVVANAKVSTAIRFT